MSSNSPSLRVGTPKMLGVRRAGATVGLHYLERRRRMSLAREQIIISDPDGLKAAANATYHQPEKSRQVSHAALRALVSAQS